MSLTSISLALVGIYVLVILIIALLASRSARATSTDYFLASRSVGWITFTLTLFATWMSTFAFLGSPGFYFLRGVNWLMPHGFLVVASPFFLWFIGRRLWRLGTKYNFLTPGDYFAHVYASKSARYLAALICLLALVPYCLIQLVGIGKVVEATTEGSVSYALAVSVVSAAILAYSLVGGVRAVIWTDALQAVLFGLVLIGGAVSITLSLANSGQLVASITAIEAGQTSFDPATLGIPITLLVMWGFGYILSPHMWQRVYMTRSAEHLSLGVLVGSVLAFFVIAFPSIIIGFLAHGSGMEFGDSDTLMVAVFQMHAQWLLPILLVAAVAAGMSTVDSQLLTASSVVSHDLIGARDKEASAWLGRATVFTGVLLLLGLALSPLRDGAIVLLASKGIGIALLLLVPLFFGLTENQGLRASGTATLATGIIVLGVLEFGELPITLPFGFGAPVAAILCQVLVGLGYTIRLNLRAVFRRSL